jgi:hypothetical protein
MDFYKLGQEAALEKVGFQGLLRAGRAIKGTAQEAGTGLRDIWQHVGGKEGLGYALGGGGVKGGIEGMGSMWKSLGPEQQALLKQLGAGAAVGGVGGGIAGGQAGGTGGAIAGALGGAGLGALGGRMVGKQIPKMQQAMRERSIAKLLERAGQGTAAPGEYQRMGGAII